jgi:hypothetical protein
LLDQLQKGNGRIVIDSLYHKNAEAVRKALSIQIRKILPHTVIRISLEGMVTPRNGSEKINAKEIHKSIEQIKGGLITVKTGMKMKIHPQFPNSQCYITAKERSRKRFFSQNGNAQSLGVAKEFFLFQIGHQFLGGIEAFFHQISPKGMLLDKAVGSAKPGTVAGTGIHHDSAARSVAQFGGIMQKSENPSFFHVSPSFSLILTHLTEKVKKTKKSGMFVSPAS